MSIYVYRYRYTYDNINLYIFRVPDQCFPVVVSVNEDFAEKRDASGRRPRRGRRQLPCELTAFICSLVEEQADISLDRAERSMGVVYCSVFLPRSPPGGKKESGDRLVWVLVWKCVGPSLIC